MYFRKSTEAAHLHWCLQRSALRLFFQTSVALRIILRYDLQNCRLSYLHLKGTTHSESDLRLVTPPIHWSRYAPFTHLCLQPSVAVVGIYQPRDTQPSLSFLPNLTNYTNYILYGFSALSGFAMQCTLRLLEDHRPRVSHGNVSGI